MLILNIFGSIVSIVGFIVTYIVNPLMKKYNKNEKISRIIDSSIKPLLLIVIFILIATNCVTYAYIIEENSKVNVANELINSFPKSDRIGFASNGQLRGFTINGYNFIVKYKLMDSIELEKLDKFLFADLLLTEKGKDLDHSTERKLLLEAFDTVLTIVRKQSTVHYY
ncbi:hypothetical protein [Anaeromicrobium sediminis]|uniref:Uncharacterized protein n=1 Tax=Anaeromicrobium sediminis TaxID=1478221 RepID=A0A267MQ22_9FIRM|nr:hypothetical protein [Anaeromicrobium sediminis]PAB60873.1 hypothetical protein CCE28_00115 [Anaeromicrobium sediminis]